EIVRTHDGLYVRLFERDLECQQVALAPGALVDLNPGKRAARFLVIEGEMLHPADHKLILRSANMRASDSTGKHWILTLGFKGPAVPRLSSDQILIAAQIHVEAVRPHFRADHLAELISKVQIPGRGARDGRRKRGGGRAIRYACASVGVIKIRD